MQFKLCELSQNVNKNNCCRQCTKSAVRYNLHETFPGKMKTLSKCKRTRVKLSLAHPKNLRKGNHNYLYKFYLAK